MVSPWYDAFLYGKEKNPFSLFERMGSSIDDLGRHIGSG